jgi:RNA polymerase sigma factor (sigma-70 family)
VLCGQVAQFDDEVLDAARAGADWAWERIYAELAPKVAGYLRAHGAGDPEDLVGEVFLHLVRGLPSFEGGGADFRAWAFTIAHRRMVDAFRRRRRRVETAPLEAAGAPAGGDVEQDAEARILETAVREAIERLPGDQRAVLLLRILGDLTIEQIAGVLQKRVGAVKALQRRGLKNLEQAYPFALPRR